MIVDASVAVKLFTPENDSENALRLAAAEPLAAPDLIVAELANSFWRMVRQGRFSRPPGRLDLLSSFVPEIVPTLALLPEALALAIELSHPAYDCFYLALAIRRDEQLVTADRRFLAALAETAHAGRAVHLGEWAALS